MPLVVRGTGFLTSIKEMDRRSFIGRLIKGAIGAAILPSIVTEASEPICSGLIWQIEHYKNMDIYTPLTEARLAELIESMFNEDDIIETGFKI